ncbi:MAG: carboxypeptidase-like regulatory domain-containing protein, partial [Chitinophagaceae bacterium]
RGRSARTYPWHVAVHPLRLCYQGRSALPLLLFFILLLIYQFNHAQTFRVSGMVTNASLEPLSYVSIAIKGLKIGTTTKSDGSYELHLTEGRYELVFSMIGYRQHVIELVVRNSDVKQNLILEALENELSEVEVKGVKRDRAEEIIRNVIRNKEKILAASSSYSAELYIRAIQENDVATKKKKKPVPPADTANRELQRMSMAEVTLKLDYEYPNRIKEIRTGIKVRGNSESLFFLTTTDGDFNFYRNLVKVPALSEMPFLSPISYSGLLGYRFKTISVRKLNQNKIYTIRIIPVKLGNALVEGEVEVLDSSWVLLKTHFEFPKFHMPEYDYFSVDQQYDLIDGKSWMVTRQEFAYAAKAGKNRMNGRTIAQFQNLRLNPGFAPKHFGNELSATSQQAYERDSSFWTQVRTEPLTEKEIRFIRYKDSIYNARHTKSYLDSIDAVYNKITWKKILVFGQGLYNRHKERMIYIGPLSSMYEPIGFGGHRVGVNGNYMKTFTSKKNISVWGNLSYGFRNQDIKGNVSLTRMYNPFNRGYYRVNLGREFGTVFAGDAWINQLKRSNVYEHDHISVAHGLELFNGLFLHNELQFAMRRSVSGYKTNSNWDSLTNDLLPDNRALAFQPYNSFFNTVTFE